MDLLEAMLIAGLCLIVGASAFILGAMLKAARQARRHDRHFVDPRRGERLDIYLGTLWIGMLLLQFSSLLRHMQPPGIFNLSRIALAGFGSAVFVCGVYAGRLLLRLEIRRSEQRSEERSDATTRPSSVPTP